MEAYRRVTPTREETPIAPNEVRITAQGQRKAYISYGIAKLTGQTLNGEKVETHRAIVLKAMGRAITKAVTSAEIIKRRVEGLHQITKISSVELSEVYEPLEEGLKTVTTTRLVSSIEITLSLDPLDSNDIGYQAPIPKEEVVAQDSNRVQQRTRGSRGGRGRGARGRGGRGRGKRDVASPSRGADAAAAASNSPKVSPSNVGASGEEKTSQSTRGSSGRGRRGSRSRGRGARGRGENKA